MLPHELSKPKLTEKGAFRALMVTYLNDFKDLPQTTNLGVRSSNLFGRANKIKGLAGLLACLIFL